MKAGPELEMKWTWTYVGTADCNTSLRPNSAPTFCAKRRAIRNMRNPSMVNQISFAFSAYYRSKLI